MAYQFVQKTGPRAGQHYTVKRGASGLPVRVYRPDPVSGTKDTAIVGTRFNSVGPNNTGLDRLIKKRASVK